MYTQTCDRIITAHNFDYLSALSIIQGEDYLEDEDFDAIGLLRRHDLQASVIHPKKPITQN